MIVENLPMVSCIMPTADRPDYVFDAINYFLNQNYPNAELIIIDDGKVPVKHLIPLKSTNIRYFYRDSVSTIGMKRNFACESARGEIIMHWDDDDWYAEDWIRRQVSSLIQSGADLCGLNKIELYCPSLKKTIKYIDSVNEQPWVYGGTLIYWKSLWRRYHFKDMHAGEDNDFVFHSGGKVYAHDYMEGYLGILHGKNLGLQYFENPRHKLQLEKWIKEMDRPEKTESGKFHFDTDSPLVSCIMPTADRRGFIPRSIELFLEQNYFNKELIILDNGKDKILYLIPKDKRIRYFSVQDTFSLGAKRNIAVQKAKGEFIMHWDDDDWYAEDWISHQLNAILKSGADICGIDQVQLYSPSENRYWVTKNRNSKKKWLTGASLIYRKSFWEKNPFNNLQIGEDDDFVRNRGAKVFAHDYFQGFIATLHANNTSVKFFENFQKKTNSNRLS